MEKVIGKVEAYISVALMCVALTYAAYQTLELVTQFLTRLWDSITTWHFIEEIPDRPVAGLFFSVLLTMELIATIRVFAHDQMVKIRIILLVGMIAVTRKILELDMKHLGVTEGLTVAGLILALSISYFLISRSGKEVLPENKH